MTDYQTKISILYRIPRSMFYSVSNCNWEIRAVLGDICVRNYIRFVFVIVKIVSDGFDLSRKFWKFMSTFQHLKFGSHETQTSIKVKEFILHIILLHNHEKPDARSKLNQ